MSEMNLSRANLCNRDFRFSSFANKCLAHTILRNANLLQADLGVQLIIPKSEAIYFAIDPDSRTIVISAEKNPSRIWDAHSEEKGWRFYWGNPTSLEFSPDGAMLAIALRKRELRLIPVSDPIEGRKLRGPIGKYQLITFSSDSQLVAATMFNRVYVWEIANGDLLNTVQTSFQQPNLLCFSLTSQELICGVQQNAISYFKALVKAKPETLKFNVPVQTLAALSPNQQILALSGRDETIYLCEIPSKICTEKLKANNLKVLSMDFSPNGELLAAGSAYQQVFVWNVNTGALVALHQVHNSPVRRVKFYPNGLSLASHGASGDIIVFPVQAKLPIAPVSNPTIECAQISPDLVDVVIAMNNGNVQVWNIENGVLAHDISVSTSGISTLAFSANGALLATGSLNGELLIWDRLSWKCISQINNKACIRALDFSSDNTLILVGTANPEIVAWETLTGHESFRLVENFGGTTTVQWSPDGEFIASVHSSRPLLVWTVSTRKHWSTEANLWSKTKNWSVSSSIAFTRDSRHLVAYTSSKDLVQIRLATQTVVSKIHIPLSHFLRLCFLPNQREILLVSGSGQFLVCDLEKGDYVLMHAVRTREKIVGDIRYSEDNEMYLCSYYSTNFHVFIRQQEY